VPSTPEIPGPEVPDVSPARLEIPDPIRTEPSTDPTPEVPEVPDIPEPVVPNPIEPGVPDEPGAPPRTV